MGESVEGTRSTNTLKYLFVPSKTSPKMSTETETIGGNFAISSPHFESLVGYVNDRGGKIFEEKQLKLEELGLAELEDQPDHFQCLVCSKIIKRKHNAVNHFRKFHTNRNQTDFETPENIFGTFEVNNSHLESLDAFVEVHGGQIAVVRQLKFQDMDLAEVEDQKDHFQCLQCYKVIKRKHNAVSHFKKFHHPEAKRIELKINCPRCGTEMSKSDLNPHMDKEHGLKNFNQLMKKCFIPSNPGGVTSSNPGSVTKKTTKKEKGDPLAMAVEEAGIEDLNNNIKTEDIGATVNIKQE